MAKQNCLQWGSILVYLTLSQTFSFPNIINLESVLVLSKPIPSLCFWNVEAGNLTLIIVSFLVARVPDVI